MRTKRGVLSAALAAAALAVGCGERGARADAEGAAAERLLPVEAAVVRLTEGYEVQEAFTGRVVARRRSDLGFERGGRVVEVNADDGEPVVAGQVLARLEDRELDAERQALEASVRETEARLALARRTRERRERLAAQESISDQAYDEARFEADALAAQLAAARARLAQVRVALELSRLVAPYAAVVHERAVDEGTVVAPGQTVLRVIETGAMEFRVGLPPQTAEQLDPDVPHVVEVGGAAVPARLVARLPAVEPDTRTVTAVFRFEAPPEGRDGEIARLTVATQREEPGFWLPLAALAESRRGLWAAYVLEADGDGSAGLVVERRELQLLHAEADRAFVRGTLRDGDRVVASGIHRVVPGQRVRALPADA